LDPSANARFALALARASRPMQIPPFSVFRPGYPSSCAPGATGE
jgi:hypothetical protein